MNNVMFDLLRKRMLQEDTQFFIKLKNGLIFTARILDVQEKENRLVILDKFQRISLLDLNSIEQLSEQKVEDVSGNESDALRDIGKKYK